MTHTEFDFQIDRLESQWRGQYGQERRALFWTAFQGVPQQDFHDAVSDCIANQRSAPLLEQLSQAVEKAKTRRVQNHYTTGMSQGGFGETLAEAARNNKAADPEFVKACMKLFGQRFGRVKDPISSEDYEQGCRLLDQAANQLSPQTRRPATGYLGAGRMNQNKGVKAD